MFLWTAFAVMTGLAVLVVLVPLSRARRAGVSPASHDTAVYRDQLREIDRDLERGLIATAEADAARAEVARRLLAASAQAETAAEGSTTRRRAAAVTALVVIPALALGAYVSLGSPSLPAQPLAARLSAGDEQQDMAVLLRRIEQHLERNPDDGRGWEVLAPVYMRIERYQDAATAFGHVIRLLGSTPDRQAALGEALVGIAGGIVTTDAKAAFQAALAGDPTSPRARFWVARATLQDGDVAGAATQFRALLADSPADAPWRATVEEELARLTGGTPAPAAPPGAPGPSADDVAAATAMPPADRDAMIRGMVDRLADRLKQSPQDRDGWLRLVRAYAVLGDPAKARTAADEARRALAGTPEAVAAIDALLRDLGLAERGS